MTKVYDIFKHCGQNNNHFLIDNILQKPLNNSLITESQKSLICQNNLKIHKSCEQMNCSDQIGLTISDSFDNQETSHSCLGMYFNKVIITFSITNSEVKSLFISYKNLIQIFITILNTKIKTIFAFNQLNSINLI